MKPSNTSTRTQTFSLAQKNAYRQSHADIQVALKDHISPAGPIHTAWELYVTANQKLTGTPSADSQWNAVAAEVEIAYRQLKSAVDDEAAKHSTESERAQRIHTIIQEKDVLLTRGLSNVATESTSNNPTPSVTVAAVTQLQHTLKNYVDHIFDGNSSESFHDQLQRYGQEARMGLRNIVNPTQPSIALPFEELDQHRQAFNAFHKNIARNFEQSNLSFGDQTTLSTFTADYLKEVNTLSRIPLRDSQWHAQAEKVKKLLNDVKTELQNVPDTHSAKITRQQGLSQNVTDLQRFPEIARYLVNDEISLPPDPQISHQVSSPSNHL